MIVSTFLMVDHRCDKLENIPNSRLSILPQNMFGGIARYECDRGYEIRGQKDRVCQGDGFWSGEAPECILSNGSGECFFFSWGK
jgi:hypothetical protein